MQVQELSEKSTVMAQEFDIYDLSIVPTEKDWSYPYEGIETALAQAKFGGKTVADVLPIVSE